MHFDVKDDLTNSFNDYAEADADDQHVGIEMVGNLKIQMLENFFYYYFGNGNDKSES